MTNSCPGFLKVSSSLSVEMKRVFAFFSPVIVPDHLQKNVFYFVKQLNNDSSVDPSIVHWRVIRNGLHGRVTAKMPFLRRWTKEKRLRYAKWHKDWTENQWQQVLFNDESSPELWNALQEAQKTTPEDDLKKKKKTRRLVQESSDCPEVVKKGAHTKYQLLG